MASTVLDSSIFKDMFGTEAMRRVFSDENLLACYVRAEVALAIAQGRTGVIPARDAAEIAAQAPGTRFDMAALKVEAENVGYPILGLVRQIAAQCGPAGKWVHWGATTQDIMDTGVVLQMREGLALIEADMAAVMAALETLSVRYRDTPMAGRTHLQHALPITFGYKCAVWLSMLQRHAERIEQMKPRVLVAQLGGAAGTLASLGTEGLAVLAEYARELDLTEPAISWHVARDGMVEAVQVLGLVTGSLGKIGFDVMLMMTNEIAEVFEPFSAQRGASSTMPQKRNPISSEILVANAKGVRQQTGLMLDALLADFERATGPWHIEWMAVPESFILAAGSLAQARFMLEGLIVDEARMSANLGMTRGLIVSEAVQMALGSHIGRTEAHDIVYDACRTAIAESKALADVLAADAAVTQHLSRAEIDRLCDPKGYLGTAPEMVDRVVNKRRPQRPVATATAKNAPGKTAKTKR